MSAKIFTDRIKDRFSRIPSWAWTSLFMAAFFGLRIWMGYLRLVTYTSNGFFDDFHLLKAADLDQYYQTTDWTTLIKTLSFPWFLNLVSKLPFSLDTMLAALWFADACLCWKMLREAGINNSWALFGFVFVLFCPCAFENQVGVRLYRNILIAPCVFAFIELCSLLFLVCWKKQIRPLSIALYSIILAAFFPFAFYIKEDGLWMLLVLLFFIICCAIGLIAQFVSLDKKSWKQGALSGCCILLLFSPLASYSMQTNRYIQANEKYYGYSDITLRTGGEFYKFIQKVYTIATPDRDLRYWAPKDAYRKALAVSPTLAAQGSFNEYVLEHSWIVGDEIHGDFLGWTMLAAMHDSNTYTSPAEIDDLFKKVNDELDQAFENGALKRDDRIQLTSQAGGRTFEEILLLVPDIIHVYETVFFLKGYEATVQLPVTEGAGAIFSTEQTEELLKEWSVKLKTNLQLPSEEDQPQWVSNRYPGGVIAHGLFWIYLIINPLLLIAAVTSWICALVKAIRKRRFEGRESGTVIWLIFFLIGISLVYAVALVWFCQFLTLNAQLQPEADLWSKLSFYSSGQWGIVFPALLLFPALLSQNRKADIRVLKHISPKKQQEQNGSFTA